MAAAQVGDPGLEPSLKDSSGGDARHYRADEAVEHRSRAGEFRPHRQQKGAALLEIGDDVAKVRGRQHVAQDEAVENHQVEFAQPDLEQLVDGKDDQRQFVQRREVGFFRRPQDGEVHQVHGRIGFQQVAPGPFAGMGLSGQQQNPQPVAHAVDRHHRPVVEQGKFARRRFRFQFDYRRSGVIQLYGNGIASPDGDQRRRNHGPVAPQGHADLFRRSIPGFAASPVLDPVPDRCFAADDAVTGRLFDHQPPVCFPRLAGQQDMDGRRQPAGFFTLRHVVHLSVGYQYGAGEALARHLGQSPAQGGHQPGASFTPASALRPAHAACFHHLHLQVFEGAERFPQALKGIISLGRSPANILARRTVNHDYRHVGLRPALFADRPRVEQERRQKNKRRHPKPSSAASPPHAPNGQSTGGHREQDNDRPRQQRRQAEGAGQPSRHWPSLRRISGR